MSAQVSTYVGALVDAWTRVDGRAVWRTGVVEAAPPAVADGSALPGEADDQRWGVRFAPPTASACSRGLDWLALPKLLDGVAAHARRAAAAASALSPPPPPAGVAAVHAARGGGGGGGPARVAGGRFASLGPKSCSTCSASHVPLKRIHARGGGWACGPCGAAAAAAARGGAAAAAAGGGATPQHEAPADAAQPHAMPAAEAAAAAAAAAGGRKRSAEEAACGAGGGGGARPPAQLHGHASPVPVAADDPPGDAAALVGRVGRRGACALSHTQPSRRRVSPSRSFCTPSFPPLARAALHAAALSRAPLHVLRARAWPIVLILLSTSPRLISPFVSSTPAASVARGRQRLLVHRHGRRLRTRPSNADTAARLALPPCAAAPQSLLIRLSRAHLAPRGGAAAPRCHAVRHQVAAGVSRWR